MPTTELPRPRKRLIAVGAICSTAIYQVPQVPALPAKVLATRAMRVTDGMAISAACAFHKLGGSAAIWARTGDDGAGLAQRADLSAEGLDVSGIRMIAGAAASSATVIVDAQGQRLVVPYHDPLIDTQADWLPLAALRDADFLHCDVRWPEGARTALLAAQELGIPSMVDGDVAPWDVLAELIPLARYAVFSDAGLLGYTACADVAQALRQVAASHQGHVGATCGADGYVWIEGGEIHRVAAPQVEVIDTLAAGDVFHGAFALALLEGRAVDEAARFACVAASLKCTRFGGRLGCPTRGEVDAAMAWPR